MSYPSTSMTPPRLHSTYTSATRYLGSLIYDTRIAPSGRLVCTVQGLLRRGIWALLSIRHQLR